MEFMSTREGQLFLAATVPLIYFSLCDVHHIPSSSAMNNNKYDDDDD
jgi:hypothetical protein